MPSLSKPNADLHDLRQAILQQRSSSAAEMERAIDAASSPACAHALVKPNFEEARRAAAAADPASPLAGLAVSVKDLFDVAGQATPAGSLILANAPPASKDATAVARLRAAGASFIGRSNMSEFAFSGVGINPHYGTPANAAMTDRPRIPGGSTSGGAITVATGAAHVGLGSDTGGSIRIPAALNGLVGFKSTARLVPTEGALPLSFTLDTVSAITHSVRDAVLVHEILAHRQVPLKKAPLSAYRLAVARTLMLEDLEPPVAIAFEKALASLRAAGARIDEIPLSELAELGPMQANGTFSPAESYQWHRELIAQHSARYDPRVLARIMRGASMSAADYVELLLHRKDWIARMGSALQAYDAVLSPTVPLLAPAIADLAPATGQDASKDAALDAEFFRVNGLLLRNPSAINMLDGCAISLPCQQPGEPPVGLMLWHGSLHDDALLSLALQVENCLQH